MHAARTAIKILWTDETNVQMEFWVQVSQRYVRNSSI